MRIKFIPMKHFLFFTVISFSFLVKAQLIETGWRKCYGGSNFEVGGQIYPTSDGGYVLIGQTNSNDYDVAGNDDYEYDGWVVRLRANGEILWQTVFPSFNTDTHPNVDLHDIQPTSDGGYIVVGVYSPPGDYFDYVGLVAKIDDQGNVQWQKMLGETNAIDSANGVVQTQDGGYMVLVNTALDDGLPPYYDFRLVKLSPTGDFQWDKIFGGDGFDVPGRIYKSSDGGYLLTGTSSSDEGEFAENHGHGDFLIIKVNESGEKQWMKLLGGSEDEFLRLRATEDGGFIGAGYSESNDGDVTSEEGIAWFVKLNENCEILWQRKYNESGFNSVLQTPEGNYILTGGTGGTGNSDIFIKQVDGNGEFMEQLEIEGSGNDYVKSLFPTTDNQFIISGYTYSQDGDFSGNHGGTDLWMIKFDSFLSLMEVNRENISFYPNPVKDILHFSENLNNIAVFSMDGREILKTTGKMNVNLSQLPAGSYILTAETATGKKVKAKFVKN